MTTIKNYIIRLFKNDFVFQFLVIVTIICTFLLSICVNKISVVSEHAIFYTISFAGSITCLLLWGMYVLKLVKKNSLRKKSYNMQYVWGEIVTIIYCIIIRLPQFTDKPRYDGLVYYSALSDACRNFNFTWERFVGGFRIADHPTQGYMSFLAIGEFFVPGKYVGVITMNLILAVISACCIYYILAMFLQNISCKYITIASLIITSIPSYMGTFSYMNPDMGLVYFMSIAVYCLLYRKFILFIFSFLLLALTKEVGMVMAASFASGIILIEIWKKRSILIKKLNFKVICIIMLVFLLLAMIVIWGLYITLGGKVWNYQRSEIKYFSTFGFHPEFIGFKLKEYFLLNFNWLAVLIIGLSSGCLAIKKYNFNVSYREKSVFIGVFITYVVVALFYCIFITFQHPRYTIILDVMLWVTALILLGYVFENFMNKVLQVILLLLSLLLFLQGYFTIDPVSLLVFEKKETGNGVIIDASSDFIGYFGPGDSMIYNGHYRYLQKLYYLLFDSVDFSGGMDIINFGGSGDIGNFFEEERAYTWQKENNWSSLFDENIIQIRFLDGHELENIYNKNDKAIYIWIPQLGGDKEKQLEKISTYYNIYTRGEITIPGSGGLEYWECSLKGE